MRAKHPVESLRRLVAAVACLASCAVPGFAKGPVASGARSKGIACHDRFQPDSTDDLLAMAWKKGERDDTVLLDWADALVWRGKFIRAASLLEQVRDKNSAAYFTSMAGLYEGEKKLDKALALYDQALSTGVKSPDEVLLRKAMVLSWMKRFDESIDLYARLIQSNGESTDFGIRCRIQRAEVISWKKDLKGAEMELREVIKLAPKNVEARLKLGTVLEWQGRFKDANDAYKDVLLIDPENSGVKQKLEDLLWLP